MAWHAKNEISVIDIQAEPLVHEIIEVPEQPDTGSQLSYEVASGTIPYLDVSPYMERYCKREGERRVGTSNYFKSNLALDVRDVRARLMRKHRILKRCWYINREQDRIET